MAPVEDETLSWTETVEAGDAETAAALVWADLRAWLAERDGDVAAVAA